MQHRGEIVKRAIYSSGLPITKIAQRLGKSRRWMYLMFENRNVDLDVIIDIGKIIHYDFSEEILELKSTSSKSLQEPADFNHYKLQAEKAQYWKDKYLNLLEEYNALLKSKKK